jgi:hypothetical protein
MIMQILEMTRAHLIRYAVSALASGMFMVKKWVGDVA